MMSLIYFELTSYTPRQVFIEYEMEWKKYPAGWTEDYRLWKSMYILRRGIPQMSLRTKVTVNLY